MRGFIGIQRLFTDLTLGDLLIVQHRQRQLIDAGRRHVHLRIFCKTLMRRQIFDAVLNGYRRDPICRQIRLDPLIQSLLFL